MTFVPLVTMTQLNLILLLFSLLCNFSIGELEDYNRISQSLFHNGKNDTCTELLETFANTSASFTFCAIKYARPIRICEQCVQFFEDVSDAHEKILKMEDESGKCKEQLMNLDRLSVIESGFEYITGLWDSASCKYCFDDTNHTLSLSNQTSFFMDLLNTTKGCFEKYQIGDDVYNKSACTACETPYCDLNKFYDSIKSSHDSVCMDIVDSMNITRMFWNMKLHCKMDHPNLDVIYLSCSCTIAALPIFFYLGAKFFTNVIRIRLQFQTRLAEMLKPSTSAET